MYLTCGETARGISILGENGFADKLIEVVRGLPKAEATSLQLAAGFLRKLGHHQFAQETYLKMARDPSLPPSLPPSSDSPQFLGTCSSVPRVIGALEHRCLPRLVCETCKCCALFNTALSAIASSQEDFSSLMEIHIELNKWEEALSLLTAHPEQREVRGPLERTVPSATHSHPSLRASPSFPGTCLSQSACLSRASRSSTRSSAFRGVPGFASRAAQRSVVQRSAVHTHGTGARLRLTRPRQHPAVRSAYTRGNRHTHAVAALPAPTHPLPRAARVPRVRQLAGGERPLRRGSGGPSNRTPFLSRLALRSAPLLTPRGYS